ncbi:hypothetical protein B0T20DRAFT_206390 [Sordaria brevicollis]|uniref:Uncharacterized protein n=1 Tax=Sordaria brevicollis TaxID=83679 RepID=A0AAE0UBU6_SORBR|nr:hypothetical protein B0T20DRAFT_206390 [Sordaria brevicollis]
MCSIPCIFWLFIHRSIINLIVRGVFNVTANLRSLIIAENSPYFYPALLRLQRSADAARYHESSEFLGPWSGPLISRSSCCQTGTVSCELTPAMPGFVRFVPHIIPFFSPLHMPAMLVNHEGISRVTKSIPTGTTARLTSTESPIYRFERRCKSSHSTTKCTWVFKKGEQKKKKRKKNTRNQRNHHLSPVEDNLTNPSSCPPSPKSAHVLGIPSDAY